MCLCGLPDSSELSINKYPNIAECNKYRTQDLIEQLQNISCTLSIDGFFSAVSSASEIVPPSKHQ